MQLRFPHINSPAFPLRIPPAVPTWISSAIYPLIILDFHQFNLQRFHQKILQGFKLNYLFSVQSFFFRSYIHILFGDFISNFNIFPRIFPENSWKKQGIPRRNSPWTLLEITIISYKDSIRNSFRDFTSIRCIRGIIDTLSECFF